jgi:Nitroreductase family
VRRCARAPSVHNTQPWRYVLHGDTLELLADRSRRLTVLDPRGRQLVISCGCALFNARVALAAVGYDAVVERFPDGLESDLLARITLPGELQGWVSIGSLYSSIKLRRTNRRSFADEQVPPAVLDELVDAVAAEGAELFVIAHPEHRQAVARLSQEADRVENADPAYRAELHAWTTDDPRRPDGVWAGTVAYTGVGAESDDPLPLRDFDTRGMGWLPSDTHSGADQCLLLLGAVDDGPDGWLRTGEALERVWLKITQRGFVASPVTQVVEVAETHRQLRAELQLDMHPGVLLRVGRAPATPATLRRRSADMISEEY